MRNTETRSEQEKTYELKAEMNLKTDFFEKCFIAMQYLSRPLKEGKKMRVIIDYDPQEPMTKFRYFNVEE